VTRTLSSAVIIFEITGHIEYLLPVALTTVISYGVASLFTISLYEKILKWRGLPYLPILQQEFYGKKASEIMDRDVPYLVGSKLAPQQIARVLFLKTKRELYPIVDNKTQKNIVGAVYRNDLLHYLLSVEDDDQEYLHHSSLTEATKKLIFGSIRKAKTGARKTFLPSSKESKPQVEVEKKKNQQLHSTNLWSCN